MATLPPPPPSATFLARSPVSDPVVDPDSPEEIRIHHPGYGNDDDDPANILLTLPAFDCFTADGTSVDPPQKGLHHRTALTACAIIANNAFGRAYLTYDQAGSQQVRIDLDGLLDPGDYWLHLRDELSVPPGQDNQAHPQIALMASSRPIATTQEPPTEEPPAQDLPTQPPTSVPQDPISPSRPSPVTANTETKETKPYPIVPSFRDWRFPHGKLPAEWKSPHKPPATSPTNTTRTSASPETTCYISGTRLGTNSCHIVPTLQKTWFGINGMARYMPEKRGIDDSANLVTLRADLHMIFDKNLFTIVPKPSGIDSYAFLVHVLKDAKGGKGELVPSYHNRSIRPEAASAHSQEALFARFALSIFPLVQSFFDTDIPRYLAVKSPESSGPKSRFVWMNKQQLTGFRMQRGETPTGSRKRLSSQMSRDDELGCEAVHDHPEQRKRRMYSFSSASADNEGLLDEGTRWYNEHGKFAAAVSSTQRELEENTTWYHEHGRFAAALSSAQRELEENTEWYDEEMGLTAKSGSESGGESGGESERLPNLSHSFTTSGSNRSSALLDQPGMEDAAHNAGGNSTSDSKSKGVAATSDGHKGSHINTGHIIHTEGWEC